jgi:Fe-S oxidoreductase
LDTAAKFVLAAQHLPAMVVGDPGCAWTLTVAYPRSGHALATSIQHWVDEVASRIGDGNRPLPIEAAYHDACYLGRGLGRYDEPRKILARVAGHFNEAVENRDDAGCSGGGGQLPRTMPDTSSAMTTALATELGSPGRTIVTACPTARRIFERHGAKAIDLATVVSRWLKG